MHMQARPNIDSSQLQCYHCCRLLRPGGELWLVGLSGGQSVSTRLAAGKGYCLAEMGGRRTAVYWCLGKQ